MLEFVTGLDYGRLLIKICCEFIMKGIFRMRTKKLLAWLLASCTLIASVSIQGFMVGSAADNGVMRDKLTAYQIAYDMGLGLNLGNTMEAYYEDSNKQYTGAQKIGKNKAQDYETCWGAFPTTQKIIDGMRDAGFKTVRIPVYWGNMMENNDTFTISTAYLKRVREIIDYCRNAGLYAVINIHHYDEFIITNFSKSNVLEIMDRLWTQIAEYYKDYSDYLIFEGYNEYVGGSRPGDGLSEGSSEMYDYVNSLNQTFVDAVRATGGNNKTRMLIASGYWTNIDMTTNSKFKMPTDTAEGRLMVSVHYVDNAMYWNGSGKIGTSEWQEYSKSQCELLKKAFFDQGYPVFLGETTTSTSYKGKIPSGAVITDTTQAMEYILRLLESYGFIPVLWDTPGTSSFYVRTKYEIGSAADKTAIQTLADELKDGTFKRPVPPIEPVVDLTDDISESSSESSQTSSEQTESSSETSISPSDQSQSQSQSQSESDSSKSNDTSKQPNVESTTARTTPHTNKSPAAAKVTSGRSLAQVAKDRSSAKKKMNQAKIKKLTAKTNGKKIIVSWKKTKKAKGYEVQVSANKRFKKPIYDKYTTKKKLTIKSNKIKKNKTYYVRIRAYTTYKGVTGKLIKKHSKWFKVNAIKIK